MIKFYLIPFLAAFISTVVFIWAIIGMQERMNQNPDKPVKNIEHTCTVQPDKTKTEITEIKPEKISITITTTCR